ncbi:MAG: transposase [Rhodospirillaceae bacterium]|nr:transposase [Rhodospirillaceae bacterium]
MTGCHCIGTGEKIFTAPGRYYGKGVSLIELTEMFPDEASATAWFESLVWPEERHCPHCGSTNTVENKGKAKAVPIIAGIVNIFPRG